MACVPLESVTISFLSFLQTETNFVTRTAMTLSMRWNLILLSNTSKKIIVFLIKRKTQLIDHFCPLLFLFIPDQNAELMSELAPSIFGGTKTTNWWEWNRNLKGAKDSSHQHKPQPASLWTSWANKQKKKWMLPQHHCSFNQMQFKLIEKTCPVLKLH